VRQGRWMIAVERRDRFRTRWSVKLFALCKEADFEGASVCLLRVDKCLCRIGYGRSHGSTRNVGAVIDETSRIANSTFVDLVIRICSRGCQYFGHGLSLGSTDIVSYKNLEKK
jgi:hypothetical protein